MLAGLSGRAPSAAASPASLCRSPAWSRINALPTPVLQSPGAVSAGVGGGGWIMAPVPGAPPPEVFAFDRMYAEGCAGTGGYGECPRRTVSEDGGASHPVV